MFSLGKIHFENFKSYAGKHSFTFPTEPGLYFFTGLNKQELKLGSNGAGKSTFLDAIYWCLFGRTLRGLRAGDVVTRGKKTCRVRLWLTVGDESFTVTRSQSPNQLMIRHKGKETLVEQAALQNYLRLTPESFIYSVIVPQFGESFFELSATNKLGLYSQIMDLDFWLEKSKLAADEAAQLATQKIKINSKIGNLDENILHLDIDIASLTEKVAQWKKARSGKIKDLELKQDALLTAEKSYLKSMKRDDEDIKVLVGEVLDLKQALTKAQNLKEDASEAYLRTKTSQIRLSTKFRAAQAASSAFSQLGAVCPTCHQKITPAHAEKQALAFTKSNLSLESELATINLQHEDDFQALEDSREQERLAAERVNSAELKILKLSTESQTHRLQLKNIDQQITELEHSLESERSLTNPFVSMLSDKMAAKTNAGAQRSKLLAENDALTAGHEAVSFWINGFKRIRLFIIEETLKALEIEVNSNLAALGMPDWAIEFDVERENKGGGVTKGFTVLVHSPGTSSPTRWEAWSGGEAQRLQLAGDLGLANLIMQQAGLVNKVEFYDEPSKHLSQEGLLDLAETLHQRALNDGKTIYLVDHRMPDFGEFAGVIRVVKDEIGSSLEFE